MKLVDKIKALPVAWVPAERGSLRAHYTAIAVETVAAQHDALMQQMVEALENYRVATNFRAAALTSGDHAKVRYADENFWRAHDEAENVLRAYKEQQ